MTIENEVDEGAGGPDREPRVPRLETLEVAPAAMALAVGVAQRSERVRDISKAGQDTPNFVRALGVLIDPVRHDLNLSAEKLQQLGDLRLFGIGDLPIVEDQLATALHDLLCQGDRLARLAVADALEASQILVERIRVQGCCHGLDALDRPTQGVNLALWHIGRSAIDDGVLDEFPSVGPQVTIERPGERILLRVVLPDDGMKNLADELQEGILISGIETEARVAVDPVLRPVEIVDAVLPDVLLGVLEPAVIRGQGGQIEDPAEEGNLIQGAVPDDFPGPELVL